MENVGYSLKSILQNGNGNDLAIQKVAKSLRVKDTIDSVQWMTTCTIKEV